MIYERLHIGIVRLVKFSKNHRIDVHDYEIDTV